MSEVNNNDDDEREPSPISHELKGTTYFYDIQKMIIFFFSF
jgi:hypothetical protein